MNSVAKFKDKGQVRYLEVRGSFFWGAGDCGVFVSSKTNYSESCGVFLLGGFRGGGGFIA